MSFKNLHSKYKLLKHLDRLESLEKKGFSYPISVDFDLTNKCNNKCPLCNGSRNKDQTTVTFDDAKNIISQLKDVGVKSVIFGGGGEPSCNPHLADIISFTKQNSIEAGIYTNGYELSAEVINEIIGCCTWARVSLDADSPEIYRKVHGMDKRAFFQLLDNISKLVDIKQKTKSNITLGTCYLIGPHTIEGIFNAAKLSKELGVDYIRFRPYFTWENRRNFKDKKGKQDMLRELKKCEQLEDEQFSVTYPEYRCEPVESSHKFKLCYVPHFLASITPDLKLYPCCSLKSNPKYNLGDLTEKSFREIWLSEERKKVHEAIDFRDCPTHCAFEKHAELLWAIKNNELIEGVKLSDLLYAPQQQMYHSNFL